MLDIVSSILGNLTAARTIAGGLVDLRDANIVAAIKTDLTERLVKAQAQLSEVLAAIIEKDARIATLEKRCRELERDQAQRTRYQLTELAVGTKVFAYALKPASELTEDTGEPPHLICQPCLDIRGHKAVLTMSIDWGTETFTCPECKTVFSGRHVGK